MTSFSVYSVSPWCIPSLRNRFGAFVIVSAILAIPPVFAGDGQTGPPIPLFNGENLDGWHVSGCEAGVEDQSLVLKAGNGWLRTDHRYGDFVLELDWKARKTADWDSGVYFRAEPPEGGRDWPNRYQVNLLAGQEGNVRGLKGAESTGLATPGEWNHFKLSVAGKTAALEINGKMAWTTDEVEAADGYIGLQSEVAKGGQFEFKNISIIELDHRPLFNGRDLEGWEGGGGDANACWKVEDGLLMCTGQPGPWLRSAEEAGDFNLRLEYKLKAGGNSGVYVRVPLNGDHRGRELAGGGPSGVEIQILDDASDRYRDLEPYQFSGSVYAIAPALEHVSRPAGRWNSLEIDCRGTSYRVVHNGVVVVDAKEDAFPELKDRLLQGFLGLQNHDEEVWFRNVRLGPSRSSS